MKFSVQTESSFDFDFGKKEKNRFEKEGYLAWKRIESRAVDEGQRGDQLRELGLLVN